MSKREQELRDLDRLDSLLGDIAASVEGRGPRSMPDHKKGLAYGTNGNELINPKRPVGGVPGPRPFVARGPKLNNKLTEISVRDLFWYEPSTGDIRRRVQQTRKLVVDPKAFIRTYRTEKRFVVSDKSLRWSEHRRCDWYASHGDNFPGLHEEWIQHNREKVFLVEIAWLYMTGESVKYVNIGRFDGIYEHLQWDNLYRT